MSLLEENVIRLKIKAYEKRLVQRAYEGSWHAMVESLYGIWFLRWVIKEPLEQKAIIQELLGKRIPLKEYLEIIKWFNTPIKEEQK